MAAIYDNICIIIPSLHPDDKLLHLLKNLRDGGFSRIILVDDGSGEKYASYFQIGEEEYGCVVLRHHINCGKGRALKTAFNHYLNTMPDCAGVVTVDSDRASTGWMISANARTRCWEHPEALILGSRDFSGQDVPARSKFGNVMTRNVFRLLCGVKITDTQTRPAGYGQSPGGSLSLHQGRTV